MDNHVCFQFPSRSENERFARAAVGSFVGQLDPTLEELEDIKTAVSEAVTNCIVHAYPNTCGLIQLRVGLLRGNTVEILVRDRGVGIPDVKQAMQPMYTTGGADRSGMGLTIMSQFMTRLELCSEPGKGTLVRMQRVLRGGSNRL